jgi:hypothetical protein
MRSAEALTEKALSRLNDVDPETVQLALSCQVDERR